MQSAVSCAQRLQVQHGIDVAISVQRRSRSLSAEGFLLAPHLPHLQSKCHLHHFSSVQLWMQSVVSCAQGLQVQHGIHVAISVERRSRSLSAEGFLLAIQALKSAKTTGSPTATLLSFNQTACSPQPPSTKANQHASQYTCPFLPVVKSTCLTNR